LTPPTFDTLNFGPCHPALTAPAVNYRSTIPERSTGANSSRFRSSSADGIRFSLPGTPQRPLELKEHHAFPVGTIRHVYTLT